MYKYCLVFLQKELDFTLDVLRKNEFKRIDYSKLVPSLADISTQEEDKVESILDFLEYYVITKLNCKEKSVHNIAFYFMTKINNLERMIIYLQELEIK